LTLSHPVGPQTGDEEVVERDASRASIKAWAKATGREIAE
jgi:hypothetical protein